MNDESTVLRRRSVMLILLDDDDAIFRFRYVTFDLDLLLCLDSKFCGLLRILLDKSTRRDIDLRLFRCLVDIFPFCCLLREQIYRLG